MKRMVLLAFVLSFLSLSVPTYPSFSKEKVVQGKAKVEKSEKASKANKKTAYKRPRYAKNINQPHEGDLLKLEGMVKGLNEQ
ncbi:MAG: hypothetical protein N3D14_04730 [Aquificaceae bacterium]|nr:hypothetical protein [Aquificaceae bacterium]MCX8164681.1 hypothetical protein [Aquificaceae bacterium]